MLNADLRPLCNVYMIINVSYTDIVDTVGGETPQTTHKGLQA